VDEWVLIMNAEKKRIRKNEWKKKKLAKNPVLEFCPECGDVFRKRGPKRFCSLECCDKAARPAVLRRVQSWVNQNPESRKRNANQYTARQIVSAGDWYIKQLLKQRGFTANQITTELIEAERTLVKLKRKIKEVA
jgi:hypothetical protein